MPLLVLIDRCPLCGCAADAGGHTPLPPAWMCIACGALSSPLASRVTVATSLFRRTVPEPRPVTWFVGTGVKLAANGVPEGLEEPLELKAITATTAPTISTRAPIPGSR